MLYTEAVLIRTTGASAQGDIKKRVTQNKSIFIPQLRTQSDFFACEAVRSWGPLDVEKSHSVLTSGLAVHCFLDMGSFLRVMPACCRTSSLTLKVVTSWEN